MHINVVLLLYLVCDLPILHFAYERDQNRLANIVGFMGGLGFDRH